MNDTSLIDQCIRHGCEELQCWSCSTDDGYLCRKCHNDFIAVMEKADRTYEKPKFYHKQLQKFVNSSKEEPFIVKTKKPGKERIFLCDFISGNY